MLRTPVGYLTPDGPRDAVVALSRCLKTVGIWIKWNSLKFSPGVTKWLRSSFPQSRGFSILSSKGSRTLPGRIGMQFGDPPGFAAGGCGRGGLYPDSPGSPVGPSPGPGPHSRSCLTSPVDHCNVLCMGLPLKTPWRLPLASNGVAWAVARASWKVMQCLCSGCQSASGVIQGAGYYLSSWVPEGPALPPISPAWPVVMGRLRVPSEMDLGVVPPQLQRLPFGRASPSPRI